MRALSSSTVEGLDQVVVGAGVQAGDAIAGGVARGQHQHRHRVAGSAQALQYLQAVHARQAEVEHGEAEVLVGERVQRARAVLHPVHGVALGLERDADTLAERGVVLDKQDAHSGYSLIDRSALRDFSAQSAVSSAGPHRARPAAFTLPMCPTVHHSPVLPAPARAGAAPRRAGRHPQQPDHGRSAAASAFSSAMRASP